MTQVEFQELKPAGPIQGLIPVVSDRKTLNSKNKEETKIDNFFNVDCGMKELSRLNEIFFEEIKKKELNFVDPENKEEHKFISMSFYQPLQFAMRASVRYLKKNYKKCLVGVTPHYVIFLEFTKVDKKNDLKHIGNVHVMEIKKLYHGKNYEKVPFLQLRLLSQFVGEEKSQTKMKLSATFTSPKYESIQKLTRIIYRNLSLAYANSPFRPQLLFAPTLAEDGHEIDDDDNNVNNEELFPSFNEFISKKLSPSQRFQFTYAANCSHDYVPYNHEVVTYFHSQIINFNGVFNAGYIPINLNIGKKDSSPKRNFLYEMVPVFRSLIYTEYIHGVVCDVPRPDIFKAVSYQLIHSSNIAFLHLSHVQASEGLSDLYICMYYNIEDCGVVYFDFSGNNIKKEIIKLNFENAPESFPESEKKKAKSFFNIFQNYKSEVLYLSFNECNFEKEHLIRLFEAMNSYKSLSKLKYLHISSSQLVEEPRLLLKDYFDKYQTLVSLDIGNMPDDAKDIEKVMETLHHQPLECLYLYNDQITDNCFKSLKNLIDDVPSLSVLDISGTGLASDHVARIVDAMSSRQHYRMLTLKASRLGIYGVGVTELVKGFLNGQLDRWDTIYLDSNKMRTYDLQLLIPVFQQMVNLRELSLSDNFDSEMIGIDLELCNLLRIPGLRILRLAGSSEVQLGNKIKPLILAIALSYQLRNKIGGLSVINREREQRDFSKETDQLIQPYLNVKMADLPGYSKYLQKKFDHILKPFLMEVKKEAAITDLQTLDAGTEWRQMFRELVPLIEKCRGIYQYKKSDIKKKSIANYTMDILVQWTNKVPINSASPLEDEIIKACESIDKAKWITMAANLAHLKHLDIKEVKIELDVITSLLKIDRELRGIEIDGCGIKKISSIVDFVETIENQPNLTKVPFPENDKNELLRQLIREARNVAEHDLNDLQFRMMAAINQHRFSMSRSDEDEIPEYPFETIPEMESYIKMENYSKKMLRSHSGICEDFRMQLPYLHLNKDNVFTGLPDDFYIDSDDIIKKMTVYQFVPPSFHGKRQDKSIAIQERFYEIDHDNLTDSFDTEINEEEDTSDNLPIPENIDFEKMRNKLPQPKWEFLTSEASNVKIIEDDDDDDDNDNDDDNDKNSDEDSQNEESDIPAFPENSKPKKPKFYERGKANIDFDETLDETDNNNIYNKIHSELDDITISKTKNNISFDLSRAKPSVRPPPTAE